MIVGLDPEQKAFARESGKLARDIAERWDRGRGPHDVATCVPSPADRDRIVEAGWLAIRSDEAAGGAEGTTIDVCVLVEQLGRYAVPAPVVGTLIALEQLRLAGADPAILEPVVAGEASLTTMLTANLHDFASPAAGAAVAFDSAGVDSGLLLAPEGDGVRVGLGGPTTGVDVTRGLTRAVATDPRTTIALPDRQPQAADRSLAFALTLVSADMLGVMQGALEAAVEHARLREQFGVPIGSFQAIQHLAAECLVSVEATRSAVWYSAWAVDELSPTESLHAARTTKAFASTSVIEVVEAAIQIFGGIGMTWESPAHVWQRRAHLDRRLFGDEETQYAHLAAGPDHLRTER